MKAFEDEEISVIQQQDEMESSVLNTDWIQELPEDLDMCIAQRDFEGAVDRVERGGSISNTFLSDYHFHHHL